MTSRTEERAIANDFTIVQAKSAEDIATIHELFLEYAASLNFSLCFQGFENELKGLPGDYAPPDGRLFLMHYKTQPAGCVALHRAGAEACEMKRLYIRPAFRGKGLGLALINAVIDEATAIGYRCMRLDTVEPVMKDAVAIYRRLGFKQIAPYRDNPIAGALYMELQL